MKKENNPLVSVVVPCYNVEKKIIPLLESLTRQTYTNLELIFINDGSTDDTEKVILSYKEKFCSMGMKFLLKTQENRGLGGASETGFKMAMGDYYIWPDADDWLADDSIKVRIDFLESHSEYSCVSSDVAIYNEDDLEKEIGRMSTGRNYIADEDQFVNLLYYKAIFCPGAHMIRMSDMEKANPNRILYPSRAGQNVQLLMPISYRMKRAFIDRPLYNYVVYKNSLSRIDNKTAERAYDTIEKLQEIYEKTLEYMDIPGEEKKKYYSMIESAALQQKYLLTYIHLDYKTEKNLYKLLLKKNEVTNDIKNIHSQKPLWKLKKLYHTIRGKI